MVIKKIKLKIESEMKYITFRREMARAYREGRKSMTRRVMVPQPPDWAHHAHYNEYERDWTFVGTDHGALLHSKPLKLESPGDEIILGTTWAVPAQYDHLKPTELPVDRFSPIPLWSYFDSDKKPDGFGKLRPELFLPNKLRHRMPREVLIDVRVERIQNITEKDAQKEGIFETPRDPGFECWSTHGIREYYATPKMAFAALWNKINAARGYHWKSNPWVWVLEW